MFFIFFPLGTDAPIYHWPYVTVGLIVVNTLAYFGLVVAAPEVAEPYVLATGDGVHPVQWLTHCFLHLDVFHLIGNMLFLWVFGMIAEGKLGPWRFLALYLASGIVGGALIQGMLLWSDASGLLGASGVIYALMAVGMIWAPANEVEIHYFGLFGFRIVAGMKEWPIYAFALLLFVWQGAVAAIQGLILTSEMAHMTGAVVGLVAGLALLPWVDCEGWDAPTLLRKRYFRKGEEQRLAKQKRRRARRAAEALDADEPDVAERRAEAQSQIDGLIAEGMPVAALAVLDRADKQMFGWRPSPNTQLKLVNSLLGQGINEDAVRLMRDLIDRHPERSAQVRLKLAQVLITRLERPEAGRRVLDEIPANTLTPDHAAVRRKLLARAAAMREEGVLELEDEV